MLNFDSKNVYDLRQAKSFSPSHYDDLGSSKNSLQAWFHHSRYKATRSLVEKYYQRGNTIVDFGCGNCSWNSDKLPVIGIDYSPKILDFALKSGKIKKALLENIQGKVSLPSKSADLVILSETLEHLVDATKVLQEIRRVLKPRGIMVVSVPYDTPLSLWWPLYKIICFVKGNLLGDGLYKKQCGHVRHFSPQKLNNLIKSKGFELLEYKNLHFLTIYMVFKRL